MFLFMSGLRYIKDIQNLWSFYLNLKYSFYVYNSKCHEFIRMHFELKAKILYNYFKFDIKINRIHKLKQ